MWGGIFLLFGVLSKDNFLLKEDTTTTSHPTNPDWRIQGVMPVYSVAC
jgi:hypothetical protein